MDLRVVGGEVALVERLAQLRVVALMRVLPDLLANDVDLQSIHTDSVSEISIGRSEHHLSFTCWMPR